MSIVNRVLLLLKMEAREDMRAASMTASIRPRKPAGERRQEGRKEGGWVNECRGGKLPLLIPQVCLYLPFGMMDTTSLG